MLTNNQMIPNRFARLCEAKKRIAYIQGNLRQGKTVMLCTPLRAVQYDKRHLAMFKATKTGAYVQRGKHWDCIDYVAIKVYA